MTNRVTTKKRPSEQAEPIELAEATISEADGVRYLHLGTPWVQGAMRVRKPLAIELEYVQRMMACLLLRSSEAVDQGHALQLGLGAGAITRFCHGVLKMRSTAVELNTSVIDACRMFFRLGDDTARLAILNDDAARYAADPAHAGGAQILCVDLYDHEAAGPVLDSEAFYRDCFSLLADGGVIAINLFGRHASFAASAERIAAAFGIERCASLQPTREGNTIVIAVKGGDLPSRELLAARAESLQTRFALPARKWLRMIRSLPESPSKGVSS